MNSGEQRMSAGNMLPRERHAPGMGAESNGEGWRVYPHREKGVLVAYVLAVNVATSVRRKTRIPSRYDTPALRARWAVGAAEVTRALYKEELALKATAEAKAPAKVASATRLTFKEVSTLWTSGDLAKDHPDHVETKATAAIDVSRLKVINEIVGDVPITEDGWIDHAGRVMRALPDRVKTAATRRHYAQVMHRVLQLAVWPLRLIDHNPLPRGFLPKVGGSKAKVYLYPTEDAQLMACEAVPLWRRILWGVLAREGMREGELIGLTWSCLDLERGVLTLDENKTDDPRAWAMNPGVVRALIAWKKVHPNPKPNKPVILEENSGVIDGKPFARLLRADMQKAKVKRSELYLKGKNRLPIRAHDLRGTFVTLSLANDRTESWVQDRTGHTSSNMINLYRRTSRTAAELGLGELLPLDEAIPELRPKKATRGTPKGAKSTPETPSEDLSDDLSRELSRGCPAPVPRGSKASSDGRIRTFVRGIKSRGSGASVPTHAVLFIDGDSDSEQHGTGANGRRLVLVGRTDRDRLALRSVAAAALGMLDVGDIESAKAILRGFLASTH